MAVSVLAVLTAILGYTLLRHGRVTAAGWDPLAIAAGVVALALSLAPASRDRRKLLPVLLVLLPGIILLQAIPLPLPVVRWVSPARAAIAAAAAVISGPSRFTTLSNVDAATLAGLTRLMECIAVLLIVRELSRHLQRRAGLIALPVIVLATAEGLLGIMQHYSGGVSRGTYANRNHYAGLLEMALPFAVMQAVSLFRRGAMTVSLAMASAGVMLLGIVFSASRMGFLAALVCLVVMAFAGARRKLQVAAAAGAAALAFVFLPTAQMISRISGLAADVSSEARTRIWRETLPLIRAYPVFGCGLGAYESSFLPYKSVAPMQAVEFAHNDYLQLLAEMGILGFGVAIGIGCLLVRSALRAAAGEGESRDLGLACTGSFAAIALHSFTDFNLYIPANAMVLAWIAGIAAGLDTAGQPRSIPRARLWMPALATGLLVLAAARPYPRSYAQPGPLAGDASSPFRWCDAAERFLEAGRMEQARYSLARALELGKGLPPIWMRAANFHFRLEENPEALLCTLRVLERVPDYDSIIFSGYDRMIPAEQILPRIAGNRRAARSWFLHTIENGDPEVSESIWNALAQRRFTDDPLAAVYLNALLGRRDYDRALSVWTSHLGRRAGTYPGATRVFNGGFESPPAGSPLDWDFAPEPGAAADIDCSMAKDGRCSLRIRFDGTANVEYGHVTQRAVLHKGRYRLRAFVRTEQLTTDQGVWVRVFDPKAVERLDAGTNSVSGTRDWTVIQSDFNVPGSSTLVTVQVSRRSSSKLDNRISGAAWVDSMTLAPI